MKASVVNNNAKPTEWGGIRFKSEYECEVYKYCMEHGLELQYEPDTFVYTPNLTFTNITLHSPIFYSNGHKKGYGVIPSIRKWTYKPDFKYIDTKHNVTYYIEAKGQITQDFEHKWKMFLTELSKTEGTFVVYLIQRQGDLKRMVEEIKNNINK